ncbi:unnamed protein product [Mytilus edulis]|uniref:Uncharacterized protein n=1 Tax=Mytilus edulis TaxID=6550 RepID=A0A8S3S0H9_MYTED|nr:unnamed protein product [Mytilus edulis]
MLTHFFGKSALRDEFSFLKLSKTQSIWTCPTGWESHGKQCYKMSHKFSNFLNAQEYCHDQNAEVIMPKTDVENKRAKRLLNQVKFEISSKWNGIWIGLTDTENENIWIWNDGTTLDSAFEDWLSGQPGGGLGENCVVINKDVTQWQDVSCSVDVSFSAICQLKDIIVNEGESVKLTCGGGSALQTKWTRSVNDTSVIVSEYANGLTLPSLVLDSVKWSDEGSYECSFTNTAGLLETRITRLFVNTSTEMCPCLCEYRRKLEYWESKLQQNLTIEELMKELEPVIRQIQDQLKVNKTELSSTIRKLTSAKDERKSSHTIGYVGALFITVIFGTVFFMDLVMFRQHIDNIRKICGYEKINKRQKHTRKRNP